MANQEHLAILKQGVEAWNQWRKEHPEIQPDLSEASLSNANLSSANLNGADLHAIDLCGATLKKARLWRAYLSFAYLRQADLGDADLSSANLSGANFTGANLHRTDLSDANLDGVNLTRAILVETDLMGANLSNCWLYGIATWDVALEGAKQSNLIITHPSEPTITVDNLEVAQFIYLLLNNERIRHVIDTTTSKVVLILGRFTEERKKVLDALREELRNNHDLTPVVFDFDPSKNQDLTETVSTLAHLSRFIIADLTDPSSVPHEMATIAPHCIRPIKPIILEQSMLINGQVRERNEYALFRDLSRRYNWVLPIYRYHDTSSLIATIKEQIITPAEQKALELEER